MDRHEVEFGQMGVTQQSFVQRLKGEGMPLHEVSSQYGDMLIKYKIHMPEQLTQLQIQSNLIHIPIHTYIYIYL